MIERFSSFCILAIIIIYPFSILVENYRVTCYRTNKRTFNLFFQEEYPLTENIFSSHKLIFISRSQVFVVIN